MQTPTAEFQHNGHGVRHYRWMQLTLAPSWCVHHILHLTYNSWNPVGEIKKRELCYNHLFSLMLEMQSYYLDTNKSDSLTKSYQMVFKQHNLTK